MTTITPGYQSVKFWDRIAERYSKQPVANEAVYQKKLEMTRAYFRSDMRLFEFGCGTGSTALVHAPHVQHIRAIDVSSNMLDIARAKASAAGIDNVEFVRATIDEIEPEAGAYDMVLGLSILHLLEDKEAALAKVHTMLKPGGIFVSSTVCIADFMPWFRVVAPIGRWLGRMPLVKIFTQDELERAHADAGFQLHHVWRPGPKTGVFLIAQKPK